MSRTPRRATGVALVTATLALTACGGSDSDSSDSGSSESDNSDATSSADFDTSAIFETTTSEEVCDVVPTSAIVDLLGGDNVTGSPQLGSVSCYLTGLNFPGVVIGNDQTGDGLTDYASVIGEFGPTQFDTTEAVTGIGDEAVFVTNDNTEQLTIAVGGNTLTLKHLIFDPGAAGVGVDELTAVARLLGVS